MRLHGGGSWQVRRRKSRSATGGPPLLALAMAAAWVFCAAAWSQDPPKPPPDPRLKGFQFDPASYPDSDLNHFTLIEQEFAGYFSGHVSWTFVFRGQTVHVFADRMLLHAYKKKSDKDEMRDKRDKKDEKHDDGDAPTRGLDLKKWQDFTLYAEGARVEIPARTTYFEAESFYYEHATGRGVARVARLKTSAQSGQTLSTVMGSRSWKNGLEASDERPRPRPRPQSGKPGVEAFLKSPLSIHAKVLRFRDFESFEGEEVEFSTCDFGIPHLSLAAASAHVTPVEPLKPGRRRGERGKADVGGSGTGDGADTAAGEGAEEDEDAQEDNDGLTGRHFIIDPEDAWLQALGHPLVPFPLGMWDTRWSTQLPIRNFSFGHSGKYGYFGEVDWNLNYFLGLVPTTRFLPIDVLKKAHLDFDTNEFEKRGFGFGPRARYGSGPRTWEPWQIQQREWNYYGEAGFFTIDDEGDEDRSTRLAVPRENRYWAHAWQRQSVPHIGIFELEYSKLSDSAVLGEYFPHVKKVEKEQETLVYGQRNVLDNLALTGLVETRTNDFQSQTERLPEGKLFLFEQPIFKTGLYSDLNLQAAYLHHLDDDALGLPPRGFDREDVYNEWAFPLSLAYPYFQARPFGFARFTHYGEVLDQLEGSDDRTAFGAGVDVSQHWSRIYRFEPGSFASSFLGIQVLKHVISPKVTYLNTFSDNIEPEELVPIDSVDNVSLDESISFTLRNELFTRSQLPGPPKKVKPFASNRDTELETVPFETRRLLDSQISFTLFPHPGRDNLGDTSSLVTLDNTLTLIAGLSIHGYFQLNPNREFRDERTDASVTYELIPGKLSATVGDRQTRKLSNVVYEFFNWTLSDKWNVDAYYAHDFETRRDVEYSVTLNRIFHRVVLSLEYFLDVGENRNMTVFFHFSPIELLRPNRHHVRAY